MSGSGTPATQNDIATGAETIEKERCAASPIDTARPENQRLDSRRDMLEHQNEHFARDILQFSHCVASKSTFSYEFSFEPRFATSKSMFRARLPSIFIAFQKMPLDAALTMRFAKNRQRDASKVLRLPCEMTMEVAKVLRLPRKLEHIF